MPAAPRPDPIEQEVADLRRQVERLEAVTIILAGQIAELRTIAGRPPDSGEQWRTPKQIEIDFGVVHSTVMRWVKAGGGVRVKKVGGRILVDIRTLPHRPK
jgi:hypothetical protein